MEQDVTTITISIDDDEIVVTASEHESGKAVGRKNGVVQWQGDGTITGMWAVGLKDPDSPFKHDRRAFSQIGTRTDGETVKGDATTGAEFQYSVFCETASGPLFLDPIIVIRDTTKDFDTLTVELTEQAAADARALAITTDQAAATARLALDH